MKFNVVVASPIWSLNGVNIFSANLVRELQQRGISSEILLTQPHLPDPKPMRIPNDIPVNRLPVKDEDVYGDRWATLIRYLEARSPCIYIPNHDIEHSGICPALSNSVAVVGVVHSDDPQHYEHVSRLGDSWNHVVTVSKTVARETVAQNPALGDRLTVVPIGVRVPNQPPAPKSRSNEPLKLLYAGVFKQQQKQILDLPKIVQRLAEMGTPVTLTIAGGGPDEAALRAAADPLVQQGLITFIGIVPHDDMPSLLQSHDVFLMTSAYEGMPNALLEAMGQGCIPVATNIDSGIPDVVTDSESGFLVGVGEIEQFADRITRLQRDTDLRNRLARGAYDSVSQGPYTIRAMVDSYVAIFEQALTAAQQGQFHRAPGKILPPPHMRPMWRHYLPLPVYQAARLSRRTLKRVTKTL